MGHSSQLCSSSSAPPATTVTVLVARVTFRDFKGVTYLTLSDKKNCWVQLSSACQFVFSSLLNSFRGVDRHEGTSQCFVFLEKSFIMWGHNPVLAHILFGNCGLFKQMKLSFLNPSYCVFKFFFLVLCNVEWIIDISLKGVLTRSSRHEPHCGIELPTPVKLFLGE